jgi:hypothetical protein
MTAIGREAAIDLTDERRSAKHQLRPDTGLSGSSNEADIDARVLIRAQICFGSAHSTRLRQKLEHYCSRSIVMESAVTHLAG